MTLEKACELGEFCGLLTVGEAVRNVELHATSLFVWGTIARELGELRIEAKKYNADTPIELILGDGSHMPEGETENGAKGNPYEVIVSVIKKWCDDNRYADMVVSISVDGDKYTELLLYRSGDEFEWLNDWCEGGTKKVELLGFVPVDDLDVGGRNVTEPISIECDMHALEV